MIRDSKTSSSTTVRYADVMSVDDKSSKDLLIGLGAAAVGATIFVLVITQGRSDPLEIYQALITS